MMHIKIEFCRWPVLLLTAAISQSDLITDIQCTRWDIASNDIIGQISVLVAYSDAMPANYAWNLYSFEFGVADEEIRFFLIVTIICKTVLVSSRDKTADGSLPRLHQQQDRVVKLKRDTKQTTAMIN